MSGGGGRGGRGKPMSVGRKKRSGKRLLPCRACAGLGYLIVADVETATCTDCAGTGGQRR